MTKRSDRLSEAAVRKLRAIQEMSDTERAHSDADDILRELLNTLGYQDVVDEYDKVEKWYA